MPLLSVSASLRNLRDRLWDFQGHLRCLHHRSRNVLLLGTNALLAAAVRKVDHCGLHTCCGILVVLEQLVDWDAERAWSRSGWKVVDSSSVFKRSLTEYLLLRIHSSYLDRLSPLFSKAIVQFLLSAESCTESEGCSASANSEVVVVVLSKQRSPVIESQSEVDRAPAAGWRISHQRRLARFLDPLAFVHL